MELVNVIYSGQGKNSQDLSQKDKNLVASNLINSLFGQTNDYIELYIYGENGDLLEVDYDASDYYPSILNNPENNTYSSLTLDPEKDARNRGYNRGKVNLQYNFYKRLFNSSVGTRYWIKEISNTRTELKLASQVLSDEIINNGFNQYRTYISTKNYYPVFYLNFGANNTVIANNVAYTQDEAGSYILVKLYEPLPSDFDVKSELWMVDKIAQSVSFDVDIQVDSTTTVDFNGLRGPNYSVSVNNKTGQTTPYYSYETLVSSAITSSFQKLSSFYQDKAVSINVDYSNFKNFIHFSSAVQRVNNFVYKLGLIESANANIGAQKAVIGGSNTYAITSQSISVEEKIIDNIIKNFDTYEYFLYYNSSSWSWPKSNITQPYSLYSVSSSEAKNFLGSVDTIPNAISQSLLWSASYYDSTNKDLYHNSIPQYLLDDPSNQPFIDFLDMVGQHFDNIWIYYKDVSNRFNATNNPETGISLDLVSDALKGLGFQLFTNTNVSDNLYYTLFGINPNGSLLPPTGSELITNYVTSSLTTLPAETIQDEIYKRLYHNLPYLYKTKGTSRAIKSLISIYGIPESILTVREFGGNFTGSLDGVIDLNAREYKINIATGSSGNVTGSLTISSSLLSPYTTIQYYEGNTRLNSTNVEVGFSPSDVINNNITSSLGIFNIDGLIGSPGYRYSSSYESLVSASNSYFSSYTQANSIWEYMRLLKFYNNSLFKTIKTFVPARANVSTGIIVKSHMLERNKYARHEPQFTFNDYSQSIDIGTISGSEGGALIDSTYWDGFLVTPLGLASYTSSNGIEKFTGELSGSEMVVTDGAAMEQGEYSNTLTGSYGEFVNLGALYQNVTASVRSTQLFDLDYNSNQTIPVNYGAVTYSISQSQIDNYATYTNSSNPIAQVQDSNYYFTGMVKSKYEGSKNYSLLYNTYSSASRIIINGVDTNWPGDSSYGRTAAIDKIKYQYGYIVNIFSSSFQMPYRAQGQVKYLIDDDQNVINLSKTNTNWFTVQNIFKSGESVDVSLFTYNNNNPYIQKLNNSDNDFTIWESGYSYSPVIYNPSGSLTYILDTPIAITTGGSSTTYTTITNPSTNYWSIDGNSGYIYRPGGPTTGPVIMDFTASLAAGNSTKDVIISYTATNSGRNPSTYNGIITIGAGSGTTYQTTIAITTSPYPGYYQDWALGDIASISITSEQEITEGSTSTTVYTTSSVDNNTAWQVTNAQNVILLSPSQSFYFGQFTSTGSYSGLDAFVFPFEPKPMDLIRLYNYSTSRWDQSGEFRIASVGEVTSGSNTFVALTVDRNVEKYYTSGSSSYPLSIYKYLLLKRLPDETSVYFNYDLPIPITEEGTLFPQYIGEGIKEGSGNVIKALKQQNLI